LDATLFADDQGRREARDASTLEQVDWNAELMRGDLGKSVQQLKRESGRGLSVGGVGPHWR